jgi:hypothetical protein
MCGMNIDTLRLRNMVWETEITTLRGSNKTIFGMLLISDSGEAVS